MPQKSRIAIVMGGGALCVATLASLTPAARPEATTRQVPMVNLADVARDSSAGLANRSLPAARAAISQALEALALAGAKEAAGQESGKLAVLRVNAAHKAHIEHIRHMAHIAYIAYVAHEAHLELLARQAREARQAAAAHRAAAQQAAAQQRASAQSSSVRLDSPTPQPPSALSGSPQEIAQQMLDAQGRGSQFFCLDALWTRESGWNVYATNPGSGAYGIPQALPGAKMASAGRDWHADAATQIRWGLSYIDSAYGSPCAAWSHEEADGWY
jgi:hypothetical protein